MIGIENNLGVVGRTNIKRQNVMQQMHRDPAKTLEVVDVKPGQGL